MVNGLTCSIGVQSPYVGGRHYWFASLPSHYPLHCATPQPSCCITLAIIELIVWFVSFQLRSVVEPANRTKNHSFCSCLLGVPIPNHLVIALALLSKVHFHWCITSMLQLFLQSWLPMHIALTLTSFPPNDTTWCHSLFISP